MPIEPFRIAIPDDTLADLRDRLARTRWPDATTFRCDAPEKLARFLFDQKLVRGCDNVDETGTLHVRWRDPEAFYSKFETCLLDSGVRIFEIRATASALVEWARTRSGSA